MSLFHFGKIAIELLKNRIQLGIVALLRKSYGLKLVILLPELVYAFCEHFYSCLFLML
jgi:hypothetical protein